MTARSLDVAIETWPLANPFVISRGSKTDARVVVATVRDGHHEGRGECVPYQRYGETVEGVAAAIEQAGAYTSREELQTRLPAGAARNALDCALWDLEAKLRGVPVTGLAGRAPLLPCETCFTLSLGTPEQMAQAARAVPHLTFLKLKLGGDGDGERMRAVRAARPDARLIADANEAWPQKSLATLLAAAADAGFELIEQPLPAGQDFALAGMSRAVPVCADESVHSRSDLATLTGRYDAVNIKLDKAGGLTEALAMANAARALGLDIVAGCMVATSLAMAPAMLIAQTARWVDLDGPLLLANDRPHGLVINNGIVQPPARDLWG
jgi:L-Ala-D/L-Glu epimerase